MYSSENKKRKTTTKKKKKKKPSVVLPKDLLLCCLARVSRLYHPTLSLAYKRFSSLLASPEFSETRSLLGRTETCLYVCLCFPPEPNLRWYTLCSKPNPNLKLSGCVLTRIPVLNCPLTHLGNIIAAGSSIYNIGDKTPSSRVSILDCRSHTWREAPSMQEKRTSPSLSVLDGKIYVIGGCENYISSNYIEVFDPKTQTWEPALSPIDSWNSNVMIDGKIYVYNGLNFEAYNPEDGSLEHFRGCRMMDEKWERFCYCVIKDVLYCYYDEGVFKWFDTKARLWKNVNGLEEMPKIPKYSSVKVAEYCGNMVVLWDEFIPSCSYVNRVFRCALISLKRVGDKIRGMIDWLDGVLTVPKNYEFVCAVATTV